MRQGEQVRERSQREDIGIEVYDLAVLIQTEYVQLCENRMQIGPTCPAASVC